LIEEIENLSEAAAKDPLTNLLNRRSTAMAVAELPQDRCDRKTCLRGLVGMNLQSFCLM